MLLGRRRTPRPATAPSRRRPLHCRRARFRGGTVAPETDFLGQRRAPRRIARRDQWVIQRQVPAGAVSGDVEAVSEAQMPAEGSRAIPAPRGKPRNPAVPNVGSADIAEAVTDTATNKIAAKRFAGMVHAPSRLTQRTLCSNVPPILSADSTWPYWCLNCCNAITRSRNGFTSFATGDRHAAVAREVPVVCVTLRWRGESAANSSLETLISM